MNRDQAFIDALKEILENLRHPERLGSHPWTAWQFVQEASAGNPNWFQRSPGEQLIFAVGELFRQMMPGVPPKRGTRLDSRWGEFGILAAKYFAPLIFGAPYPTSLRDAWGRIDASILLFVYGKSTDTLPEDAARYRLVADELEVAPNSTLSDWQRKGLERLAEIIQAREQYLNTSISPQTATLPDSDKQSMAGEASSAAIGNAGRVKPRPRPHVVRRSLFLILGLAGLLILVLGGIKAWQLYHLGSKVWQDVSQLHTLQTSSLNIENVAAAGPLLHALRQDLETLHQESGTALWLGTGLRWLPVYGCDLASAQDLLDMANYLAISADEAYQAAQPVLSKLDSDEKLDIETISKLLVQSQPRLSGARRVFDQALAARSEIDPQCLSSRLRAVVVQDVDPLLALMDDGLSIALALPELMGATNTGPKTYLLLAQNEDELRPTGGFITAAGNLVVKDGKVVNLSFEDSYEVDDWSKPYPLAPWQLDQYMNLHLLLFRDSNWFSDYPTTALWAEYLYAYSRSHSVDGVIAFDQQMLVLLLETLGTINVDVEGVPYPITSDNIVAYMRASKAPASEDIQFSDWNRKAFLNPLASALRGKILAEDGIKLKSLLSVLQRALNERHLLLQFDNPAISQVIARHGWDGAIRPEDGDFLMVVDTNIGYSKTNAVVAGSVAYDVDLTDVASPLANLTVFRKNLAAGNPPCVMGYGLYDRDDRWYPINRCYWNYLRVYVLKDVALLDASPPPPVPDAVMVLNRSLPAPRVDTLDEEIKGIQGFGALMVVPCGQSANASFRFALPTRVLLIQHDSDQVIYKLKVQKQPGTLAIPITIRIHLPSNAILEKAPKGAIVQGENVLINTQLRIDIQIEIVFRRP